MTNGEPVRSTSPGLVAELRRRNVFRMAGLYLVGAWLLVQVAATLLPVFDAPAWVMKVLVGLLAAGFVAALVFSWVFELGPAGLVRDDGSAAAPQAGRRMDRLIVVGLLLVVALMAMERFWPRGEPVVAPHPTVATADPAPAAQPPAVAKSIAVLPFLALSKGEEDGYFADGLTEEIINALTTLPDLLVTARTSAFHFKGKDTPVPEIARTLGVAHVLEGSVRRAGDTMRITAQLIRAEDGFHLWSQTYDRPRDDVFAAQTDIAENVARALGVLLDDRQRKLMAEVGLRDVEAYLSFMRGRELYTLAHGQAPQIPTLARANLEYEAAIARKPDLAQAYFEHSDLYAHILMDELVPPNAAERSIAGPTAEEARQRIAADLAAAIRLEKDPAMRQIVQVVQSILSEDWTGLGARLDRALQERIACRQWAWVAPISLAFGREAAYEPRARERAACNPFDALFWVAAFQGTNHTGRPEETLAAIERAERLLGEHPQWLRQKIIALAALGRTDELRAQAAALPPQPVTFQHIQLVALIGTRAEADAAYVRFVQSGPDPAERIAAAALTGRREDANALAARVDLGLLGAASLARATATCACGAPFDLASTPRLAQRIAEAGFPWPPRSPVDWPLKEMGTRTIKNF